MLAWADLVRNEQSLERNTHDLWEANAATDIPDEAEHKEYVDYLTH